MMNETTIQDHAMQKAKNKSHAFMQVDKGGLFNYLLVNVAGNIFAIDDNYFKTDILPINRLRKAERLESGLYILRGQTRTKYGLGKIDQFILPVYLAGALDLDEKIRPDEALYMLIKRSASGIPRYYLDEETGKRKELNFSLALVVNEVPDFSRFEKSRFRNLPSDIAPVGLLCGDEKIIPVLDVEAALKKFTRIFCDLYPELSQYYPFSPDFKFKEFDGFQK